MSPAREEPPVSWPSVTIESKPYRGPPRNVHPISEVQWDKGLQPKTYSIFGTHPDAKVLFLDVNIIDSTGKEPFRGDVLIEGTCSQHHADLERVSQ
jgi:hypothetical protein